MHIFRLNFILCVVDDVSLLFISRIIVLDYVCVFSSQMYAYIYFMFSD